MVQKSDTSRDLLLSKGNYSISSQMTEESYPIGKRLTSYDTRIFESLDKTNHIFRGFVEAPPTLEDALKATEIPDYDNLCKEAKEKGKKAREKLNMSSSFLTNDEAGAIACYTSEPDNGTPPYKIVNEGISTNRSNAGLKKSKKLIYLLLSGLRKLPRTRITPGKKVYRGINIKVPTSEAEANGHQYYECGRKVTWWGFTSTSTDRNISGDFTDSRSQKTLFIIGGDLWGYDIQDFSFFRNENEILLEPEAKVEVKSISIQGSLLEINVDFQPFENLVLEDIIKVPNAVIPKDFKAEDHVKNSLKLSWSPIPGSNILYQVSMKKKSGFLHLLTGSKIVYEGNETSYTAKDLEIESEYNFWVRCNTGSEWERWSESVTKKVEPFTIEIAVKILEKYSDNADVCINAFDEMIDLVKDPDNQARAEESKIIEIILDVMGINITNADVCAYGCAILSAIVFNYKNQVKTKELGAVDVVLEAINEHIDDESVCTEGCNAIWNMSAGYLPTQKYVCKKGGVRTFLEILKRHKKKSNVIESCCGAINTVLSSQGTHTNFFDATLSGFVTERGGYVGSESIRTLYYGFIRENYEKVDEAVRAGECTKKSFPKCCEECKCDENYYCSKCCVQQKAYRCYTCDREKVKFYCETCWEANHKDHDCKEFFCVVRCATQ